MGPQGQRREVGGWGFPAGDEGSGAWLGLRAAGHLQQVCDGRAAASAFSEALAQVCGRSADTLCDWLAAAGARDYAALAPLVLHHAATDGAAQAMVQAAAQQVERLALALDPEGRWPLALCGGLAAPLAPWCSPALRTRATPAQGDSAQGALRLLARHLDGAEA